ncbi:MAG: hypothetical protein A3D41_03205 [Candidatus Sungbacteria bacterium RIFCSPHIGHO2_02_FULL_41_12b]|nr:MAG: hypothetical protein A3D41_03205 [Candidatus Sungbacteria bacterium RIFCSPHIGHO2_02_FULL_41_12b]
MLKRLKISNGVNIPLCRPSFDGSELEEVRGVLASGWVAHGPKNKEFEKLLADFFGVKEVILLNSCASALEAALVGLGIRGEVIIPSFTMSATANAVVRAGAAPVFCDVEWKTGNMDASLIEGLITKKTEVIMPVHFAGFPCDMDAIAAIAKKHNLYVIEDSAECIGGKWNGKFAGTFGSAGCFSFWATKNITTGEGGVIITNDHSFAERVRTFMSHGISRDTHERQKLERPWERDSVMAGVNYRMGDIPAAIGVAQMKKLSGLNAKRKKHAEYLNSSLNSLETEGLIELPREFPGAESVWQMYVIKVKPEVRDGLVLKLRENGIGASVHFDPPVHLQTFYKKNFPVKSLPATEKLSKSVITLPLFPDLTESELDYIVGHVKLALA